MTDCEELYDILFELYGMCECPLKHETPFQLLVAVMLSAQCRDARVNQVTPELFALAPDPQRMAQLPVETIEKIVHVCGLSGSKSRNIQATAAMLLEKFHGEVPRTMEELVQLPGVGRKSANVILGNCFNLPGFPVDTHVNRLLNRIGLVKCADPVKIEAQICPRIAPEKWCNFSHLLIWHGRQVCSARQPDCAACPIKKCQYRLEK